MEPEAVQRVQSLLEEAYRGRDGELRAASEQCGVRGRELEVRLDALLGKCSDAEIKQRVGQLQKYTRMIQTIQKDLSEVGTMAAGIDGRLKSIEEAVDSAVSSMAETSL